MNGNMVSDGINSGIGHDLGNRLFRIASSASGAAATYAYDAQDRRVRVAVSGAATTRFLWSGAEEVADLDDGGALLRFIGPGPGVDDRVAMVAANDNTPKGVAYFHADRLGSVVATTDGAGLAAATYAYSPYGESDAPLSGNPFRFTGSRLDFESGLYHYRARYYSPRLGQFLQTDPIGTGDDPNLYLYVGLDPVNAVDPMGRCAAWLAPAGGAALAEPSPFGEAAWVLAAAGSCIYRGYRLWRAQEAAQSAAEAMGTLSEGFDDEIFEHIDVARGGKIKNPELDVDAIPEKLLGEAEELLGQSIRIREEDNKDRPRGNPNGDDRQRRDNDAYRRHEQRIQNEQGWREQVRERRRRLGQIQ